VPGDDADVQARYVEATVRGVRVGGLYLPNGNPVGTEKYPYKLGWMDRLRARAETLLAAGQPFVMGGDFNVIPEERDAADPAAWVGDALFLIETRRRFRALLNLGLTDSWRALNPTAIGYSFWDYQNRAWQADNGIRIDHLLASPEIADRLDACIIDREPPDLLIRQEFVVRIPSWWCGKPAYTADGPFRPAFLQGRPRECISQNVACRHLG